MSDLKVTVEPGSQNVNSTVTIKASKKKVFEAFTNPELFVKWWGRGHELEVSYFDAINGGKWRVTEHTPEGESYSFRGTFHEIAPEERIIQTFEFEGLPERGHVALDRADFFEIDNNTTEIKIITTFQSIEDRDGMMASGMEDGYRQSINALGALLEVQ